MPAAGFVAKGYGARSLGGHGLVAVVAGDWAISQLWLFWLAPIVGAVLGAVV